MSYAAPDVAPVSASSKRPLQIKIALTLLALVSLSEIFLPTGYLYATGSLEEGLLEAVLIFFLLSGSSLAMVVLLVFVGLRHNWARWVWLVLTILGIFLSLPTLFFVQEFDALVIVEQVENLVDIIGTALLFFGAGGRWFQRDAA